MARKLAIEIIGDAASLKAALGSAAAATEKFAAGYKTSFDGMSASTLRLAVAQDQLAISTAKYGIGTTGAAKATVAYRREVESLAAAQMRAAESQRRSTEVIGRSITRSVTVPAAIVTAVAVKMGVDFNKQMLQIQTSAGATAEEIAALRKPVLDLGPAVGMGPSELAKGLYHLESLGLRGSKAMAALRTSAIAAGMGVADLEDVTTALGGAVVSGIKGAEDFNKTMGTIKATIGVGNMRLEDFVGFLGTGILPAAKNAGVSLDQVGAALAVMTDRGVSAENAGTRLRMTFALMQAPSNEAVRALADMGISADDMASTLRQPDGLLKVLTMLHEAMNQVGKVRGSRDILKAFGGGRSGAGILTLVQSLDSSISSFEGKLHDIRTGQESFAHNTKVYMESPAFRLQKAIASLETSMTKLGESLTPAVVGVANSIAAIAKAFDALPGFVKTDIGIIVGVLAVGGPLMLAMAGIVKATRLIGTTFGLLPAKALPGIAATEAEVATLGGTMAAATGEATALQAALIGIARLAGPIGIAIAGIQAYNAASGSPEEIAGPGGGEPTGHTKPSKGYSKGHPTYNIDGQSYVGYGAMSREGKNALKTNSNAIVRRVGGGGPMVLVPYNPSSENAPTGVYGRGQGGIGPGVRDMTPKAAHIPNARQMPQVNLPKSLQEGEWWALTTPKDLTDDVKNVNQQIDFFKKNLGLAKKGTDVYDTLLQEYSQAIQKRDSLQAQQANIEKKKHKKSTLPLPADMLSDINRAKRSGNDERELRSLQTAADYLKRKISLEKDHVKRAKEEQELTKIWGQIQAVRKSMGDKIIASYERAYDAAKATAGVSDDIRKNLQLQAALKSQIKLQKDNTDLQKKLSDTQAEFADIRKQMVDDMRQTFGALGAGPSGGASSDPFLKWQLGVQWSAKSYLNDLQRQIKEFNMLESNFSSLTKKGAPKELIDELRSQGQDAFPEVFALAHADKGTLGKFFAAYKEREKVIQNAVTAEINASTVTVIASKMDLRPPSGIVDPGKAGRSWDLRPPSGIVRMATGGIVTKPTVALIGEAGREAIVPLGKMGGSQPVRLVLELDGRTVADVVLDNLTYKAGMTTTQVRGRAGGVRYNLV